MDSPKLPEITVEARETDDEKKKEKKRSGFFFDLFGKGGRGLSGALGGSGVGGGGLFGGLLATKAGLIGLILTATTLAGGLGVLGYKMFGPGANSGDNRFSSIFAQKSKEQMDAEARAEAAAAAAADGSLNDLAKANSGAFGTLQQPGAGDGASTTDKPKQDAAAISDAAKAAAAAAGAAGGANGAGRNNNTNVGGNRAASFGSGKLATLPAFGAGAGAGGSNASFSVPQVAAGQKGRISGFGAGPSSNLVKPGAASRARKFGGAVGQLLSANRDGTGNKTSMQGVGATMDGNGAGAPISAAGAQPVGGAGDTPPAAAGTPPSSSPGTSGPSDNRFADTNVPPTAPANVTPWQAAVNTAAMLIAAAALLLYAIKMVGKTGYGLMLGYVMAGLAAAIGAYVIYLGSLIGGNFYGQHLQGQMFELSGTFIITAAASAMFDMKNVTENGPNGLMMLSGAAALGSAAVAYLSPMRSVPAADFKNGFAPDYDYHATESNSNSSSNNNN